MTTLDGPAVRAVRLSYQRRGADPDLREILARFPNLDDRQLADLIEADATIRLADGLAVELDRYLAAIPDLPSRALPLDTAIDYALRWLAPGGTQAITVEAAEELIARYPALADPIREAVVLGQALESAAEQPAPAEAGAPAPELPRGFGPRMASRRPRYLLKKQLGRGSHGAVFLAVDRHLSETNRPAWVALKILGGEPTAAARQRLIDEACKARRVDHPNVVRVLDWGTAETGEVYVVFEYVDGASLDDWLIERGGKASPRDAARLVAKIARAIQAAHSAGVVHCDLKPANVLVTRDGVPKVTDFGVAAREQEYPEGSAWPDPKGRIGNLAFIAPEQYRLEEGSLAPPADIYALGGLLYYLLTGSLPNGDTAEEIARTHDPAYGRTAAPSPRHLRPEIDRDLDRICRRALAPHKAERYPTADAMAVDLDLWLAHRPIEWMRPGIGRRLRLMARRTFGRGGE